MKRRVYFRYNPATDTYERVYPTRRERVWQFVKHLIEGIVIGAALFVCIYTWVEFPRERKLQEQNNRMQARLVELEERLERSTIVMDKLAERDNNFYRVIMHLDPITASQRYSGLDAIPQWKELTEGNDSLMAASLGDDELVRSVTAKLNLFERQLFVQSQSFDHLARAVETNADRILHIPSIQPVNERDMRQMASGYGYRIDPIYGTTKHHDGMDFAAPIGTPVYATGDGVVTFTGPNGAYGKSVEISHGYNYLTRYAHLSEINVRQGQHVTRGDLIGKVGNTGKATGSHLHYEVRYKDIPQNPVNYYFSDLSPEEYARMVNEADNAAHVMD